MPYFIPNHPGVFATRDEATAAALPKPPAPKPFTPKDKPTPKVLTAPKED